MENQERVFVCKLSPDFLCVLRKFQDRFFNLSVWQNTKQYAIMGETCKKHMEFKGVNGYETDNHQRAV